MGFQNFHLDAGNWIHLSSMGVRELHLTQTSKVSRNTQRESLQTTKGEEEVQARTGGDAKLAISKSDIVK